MAPRSLRDTENRGTSAVPVLALDETPSAFAARVEREAARRAFDRAARRAGEVIAHELGHLVLPVNSHSSAGIMRAHVNLQASVRRFTAEQRSVIRAILANDDRIAGR